MKKILLLAMVCCAVVAAQAQRVYFMYVQTDNKSPFYLKTGDKVHSSSAQGFLIVPKLVDSTYHIVIGKNGFPEARFTITINGKDRGFALREGGQKLTLFDLQSLELIEPAANESAPVSYTKKTDRFTTLLAQAADDTTLLQAVVVAKNDKPQAPPKAQETVAKTTPPAAETIRTEVAETAPPVTDTQATVQVQNTATAQDTTAAVAAVKEERQKQEETAAVAKAEPATERKRPETPAEAVAKEPVAEEGAYKRSVVTRRAESSTSEGFGLVFTDSVDGVVDTIRIVIPNPKAAFNAAAENNVQEATAAPRFLELDKATAPAPAKEEAEEPKKRKGLFGNKKEAAAEENVVAAEGKTEKPAVRTETVKTGEDCRSQASGSDFARLRRNLVSKSSEDDMVAEAAKAFKSKCYTTEQIKTLSSLLLTSNGRYRLFEAAYNHVSDKENFRSLQNDLWDRADIERFKALIAR